MNERLMSQVGAGSSRPTLPQKQTLAAGIATCFGCSVETAHTPTSASGPPWVREALEPLCAEERGGPSEGRTHFLT